MNINQRFTFAGHSLDDARHYGWAVPEKGKERITILVPKDAIRENSTHRTQLSPPSIPLPVGHCDDDHNDTMTTTAHQFSQRSGAQLGVACPLRSGRLLPHTLWLRIEEVQFQAK